MTAQQLIDAVLQLKQAVQEGQQREVQIRAQVETLAKQGAESQQREAQLRTQVETLTQQLHNPGTGQFQAVVGQAFQALAQSQKELMDTDFDQVLAWSEEEGGEISLADLKGATQRSSESRLEAINAQLYAVLQSLCNREAFTIVRSAGRGNGVDGWHRLVKRYDPFTETEGEPCCSTCSVPTRYPS